jgi:hypothetical protein
MILLCNQLKLNMVGTILDTWLNRNKQVSDKNIEQQKIAASVRLSVRSNSLYIVLELQTPFMTYHQICFSGTGTACPSGSPECTPFYN